ncbi:hypothetical protein I3842_03G122700 [Carya illinoinensis]|uniref:Uncharacterized protein n=1 Tax=Carya illinoinensis TaxID=32201 RepID=A0A922FK30_CARIL|nr:hypothetical protein I3842_03G122700 [Carya illinoinensis]
MQTHGQQELHSHDAAHGQQELHSHDAAHGQQRKRNSHTHDSRPFTLGWAARYSKQLPQQLTHAREEDLHMQKSVKPANHSDSTHAEHNAHATNMHTCTYAAPKAETTDLFFSFFLFHWVSWSSWMCSYL